MKKTLFCTLCISLASLLKAQEHALIHEAQVTSKTWELIAQIKYNTIDEYEYYPIFSNELKALHGKKIELNGYMIPIREGMTHTYFLLSVLPIAQCHFCGKGGIPVMVEVNLAGPGIRYTDKVIKVKGTVALNEKNMAFYFPVVLYNAKLIE